MCGELQKRWNFSRDHSRWRQLGTHSSRRALRRFNASFPITRLGKAPLRGATARQSVRVRSANDCHGIRITSNLYASDMVIPLSLDHSFSSSNEFRRHRQSCLGRVSSCLSPAFYVNDICSYSVSGRKLPSVMNPEILAADVWRAVGTRCLNADDIVEFRGVGDRAHISVVNNCYSTTGRTIRYAMR